MCISLCQCINRITCCKLLCALKPSESLSRLVGVSPVNHFIAAEHFLLVCFFSQVSTGLPTHPSYLPVPAETRPHLAFCVHPHISLLVCLIFDQLELTGRKVKVARWERRWQRHDLLPSASFLFTLWSVISSCIFCFFWNMWLAETADTICGNQFYGRVSCWEGREWSGKEFLGVYVSIQAFRQQVGAKWLIFFCIKMLLILNKV